MIELILGGARSGKSRLAEQRAIDSAKELFYIATAQAGDSEMEQRIAHHRQRRDQRWTLIEEPVALADALIDSCRADRCVLVDCLTLWLTNVLHSDDTTEWPLQREKLLACVATLPGDVIFVSNEVGMGVVPMGELSRRFVDESGRLHQDMAQRCQRVTFIAAGLPMVLKE